MSDDDLYDKYEKKTSSAGIPPLRDPAEREDPDRPLRTEDLIPRHGGNKRPKIWLPDGSKMEYYGRPSGWGQDADNGDRLKAWEVRITVSGYLDYGEQSKSLRLQRSVLPPPGEDKGRHDALNARAKRLAFWADENGSAVHKMSEKYDLGIPFNCIPEYEGDLEEWVRMTRFMQIVDLPTGQPGVECFVVLDAPRLDEYGQIVRDERGDPVMVRLAGTFDRLLRYIPCTICGRSNYIADLKTSAPTGLQFAQRKSGIQLGTYSRSKLYVPWSDGRGADRYTMPDVCQHRGILISLPAGTGKGSMHWIDIARGYERAVRLIPQIKDHQSENDWMVEFTPVPDMRMQIDSAQSHAEVQALWRQYPGPHWTENDGALTIYASNRIAVLNGATAQPIKGEVIG